MTSLHSKVNLFLVASVFQVALCSPNLNLPRWRVNTTVALERTRSLALLFSSLQCISETDADEGTIREINSNFDPNEHLSEYNSLLDVERLLRYVNNTAGTQHRNDDPFTNSPEHVSQLSLILNVLYFNSDNWPLFYNTSVWLIDRVNSAQLFWSLMIVSGEKFPDTVLVPTAVEVFPQLFINKQEVGRVAGRPLPESSLENHPLQYYTSDPGINEFHTNWHIDNPFWWDAEKYEVKRDRKGELFLYMHHQLLQRYQSELLSNGLPPTQPLELDPEYKIPEAYYADIVNVNYEMFPLRRKGERMKDFDDGTSLTSLQTSFDRLNRGIEQGCFMKANGTSVSLRYENGSDILGSTTESSTIESANVDYYGSFHNFLHRYLGAMAKPRGPNPGVVAHSETAMRDPVFYRLHGLIDTLYYRLKSYQPAYTKHDLDYPALQIKSVAIQSSSHHHSYYNYYRKQIIATPPPPVLTTYMNTVKYDISDAARPCVGMGDPPVKTEVTILDHFPFDYIISLKSNKNSVSHGMVRIFLLPEYSYDGRRLDIEESHQRAIQLDVFRIQLGPYQELTITRSSMDSAVTRLATAPGIKTLYKLTSSSVNQFFKPKMTRACGFPHNLLIPKGTTDGLRFKLTVMVSEESEPEEDEVEYPNYPYCGCLNGYRYPDKRSMGFPFDRPGTRFISYDGIWAILGGYAYKNVKQMPVIIKHQTDD